MQLISFLRTCFANYAKEPFTPFVVLFLPRTGSNYLAGKLDSHPEIICHHELFNPEGPHQSLSVREGARPFDLGTAEQRDREPFEFVRRVFKDRRDNRAVGFKIGPMENWPVFVALLLNRSVRKICLTRDNWLAAFVSSEIANATRTWISFADADANEAREKGAENSADQPAQKVHVDLQHFRRYVMKRRVHFFALWVVSILTFQRFVRFEFLEISDEFRIAWLIGELGADTSLSVRARTKRQRMASLAEKIENLEEVREALKGTVFADSLS